MNDKENKFLKTLTANLPNELIEKEFSDYVKKSWDDDVVNEVLAEDKEKIEDTKKKLYTFTCDICNQNKQHQTLHRYRVNGFGIDPKKYNKICDSCFNYVDWIREKEDDFF